MEIHELYELYTKYPSVQTDSRKIKEGDIFFALRGPNFNGNDFAKKAIEEGALLAIVDEDIPGANEKIIRVGDSLQTLQKLASYHRDHFHIPFIAITGSNGKTTTKELVHAVLSSGYTTYTTRGNLNNHIGVPLAILNIRMDAEMAVIEMGANHLHEIESYCQFAKPGFGLITNIGKAHLEGFGGEEGVKKGKGELFEYLAVHDGTAFVNADDGKVLELSRMVPEKVLYGAGEEIGQVDVIERDPFLKVKIMKENELTISTQLVGYYNLSNVLAAVTIGKFFDIPDEKIKKAIEDYIPSDGRSQMIRKGTNIIILDAYNANPGSMKAAVENFAEMRGENKILILGEMKELGEAAIFEHKQLIRMIDRYKWKDVALTGPVFSTLKHGYRSFDSVAQAKEWFQNAGFKNSLMLVKGSRSMQMEKVIE